MNMHVSIKDAKDRLSELVRSAERGETAVITRNGQPVADLVPHKQRGGLDYDALERWKKARGLTRLVGRVADDFDAPLPEDFLTLSSR